MKIKDVKVITHFDAPDDGGDRIPVLVPHFDVTTEDDELPLSVPFDPGNRDYHEVKDWYESQKKPAFKFDFKKHKPE